MLKTKKELLEWRRMRIGELHRAGRSTTEIRRELGGVIHRSVIYKTLELLGLKPASRKKPAGSGPGKPRVTVLPEGRKWCVHCGVRMACKARGLCDACHKQPAVRGQNVVKDSPHNRRGRADRMGAAPLPAEPTDHPVGSEERFLVMEERAARGEQLYHPGDTRVKVEGLEVVARVGRYNGRDV